MELDQKKSELAERQRTHEEVRASLTRELDAKGEELRRKEQELSEARTFEPELQRLRTSYAHAEEREKVRPPFSHAPTPPRSIASHLALPPRRSSHHSPSLTSPPPPTPPSLFFTTFTTRSSCAHSRRRTKASRRRRAKRRVPSRGSSRHSSRSRAWNIHTFIKFDEFSMNLSPNLSRDSQMHFNHPNN